MKKQIKDSWEKEREESRVAETLKIKYRFLETQHTNLDKECQELKKNLASLDKFIILYEKLNKKLQDYGLEGSLDKLFQKMEYLENVCLELTKRKLELEDSNLSQEKERLKLKNHYEDIINRLHKEGNEREKFVKSLKEAQDAKNLEYEIDFSYKPQYMKLFNQILQLYAKWTKNLDIFQKDQQIERLDNNLPNTALETPEEVLCLLDKIIMISTPQSAQAYIRKIIGSSLRLLRRFLPEKLIEMYEPEKFYCYLSEYIDKLQREVQKCRNDVEVLKRKNKESLKKIKENSTEKKSNDKGLKNITDIAHERRKALK